MPTADGSAWAATGRNGAACSPPLGQLYRYGPPGEGTSWQPLPPWRLTQVTALDALSTDVAYAIGGQDLLSRTGDGGQHWTQLRPALAPAGLLDVLSPETALGLRTPATPGRSCAPLTAGTAGPGFSDASRGWLVAGGVTWRTADGGASWIRG
ncbi:MAG: WD40/YVTN/BNR-like repeat-containing protein [Streptosporangiaceae bacterium]